MNKHEIYKTVVNGLASQHFTQAKEELGGCKYLTEDGKRCSAGHLEHKLGELSWDLQSKILYEDFIDKDTDGIYKIKLTHPGKILIEKFKDTGLSTQDFMLICLLQRAHDFADSPDQSEGITAQKMINRLRYVEKLYLIDYRFEVLWGWDLTKAESKVDCINWYSNVTNQFIDTFKVKKDKQDD